MLHTLHFNSWVAGSAPQERTRSAQTCVCCICACSRDWCERTKVSGCWYVLTALSCAESRHRSAPATQPAGRHRATWRIPGHVWFGTACQGAIRSCFQLQEHIQRGWAHRKAADDDTIRLAAPSPAAAPAASSTSASGCATACWTVAQLLPLLVAYAGGTSRWLLCRGGTSSLDAVMLLQQYMLASSLSCSGRQQASSALCLRRCCALK